MKRILLLSAICMSASLFVRAQTDSSLQKIAIFAPLYLDSAFNDTVGYRYAKNVFPKFINPGIEFYEGVQLALDSINREKLPLEVFVYDTRSATVTLPEQLEEAAAKGAGLIIAHCGSNEVKTFADAGLRNHIPVINVNMPNDGGVTANPYYVMLNPTLRTQCEGIYRYIQKYYSLNPLVVFRKKGQLEDRIRFYFEEYAKSTMGVPLRLHWVDLSDSFSLSDLRAQLDTLDETLCIAGSLDENFGKRLIQQLATLARQNYKAVIMGMPTWDDLPLNRPEYKGIGILYSTPFYNGRLDKVSSAITSYFNRVMFARPSDMVFRGYEVAWKFAKLLNQFGQDLSSNLSNKQFKLFTDFDIQPVLNKQTMTLDYFENKKLYFARWQDGLIRSVF